LGAPEPAAPVEGAPRARDLAGAGRLERLALEVADWRMTLELSLLGAALADPAGGLARLDACGVTAGLIDRPDARLMYYALRCCAANGDVADKAAVLATARCALRWGGLWEPAALATERGLVWSDAALANLACAGADGPADVDVYAAQLRDLDARQREARACWERMVEVLEGA
jgi:hypothetical protein